VTFPKDNRRPAGAYATIHSGVERGLAPGLAIILDMDGVIVDSNPVHREAWRTYNHRFGIETDEAMQQRMYGKRNDEIVRDFFGPHLTAAEVSAHGAAKESLFREMMADRIEESLVPGVREFLDRYAGTPKGLATNAEPPNVDFVLDRAGLRHYFQVVIDGHQVRMPKPDPEIYLRAAGILDVAARDCIVFEDSLTGIEAARRAGMRTVGVKTTHAELPDADLTIDDFRSAELEPWLRRQIPSR
jgi:beta-phosphoglucomutase